MDDNNSKPKGWRRSAFLHFMRILSVIVFTIMLLLLLITSTFKNDLLFVGLVVGAFALFFINIPLLCFWIYSFVLAIKRRTKTDRILLWFQIADVLLFAACIYISNLPSHSCDADVMELYYGKYGPQMHDIANRYHRMLPDSSQLYVEFEEDSIPHSDVISDKEMARLKAELDECDCIGIVVDNYSEPQNDYAEIMFRRQGFGMYSYRLYRHPLTAHEKDSINDDYRLIVFNDSTVFEYGSGVFGSDAFPGKENYMIKLGNKRHKQN